MPNTLFTAPSVSLLSMRCCVDPLNRPVRRTFSRHRIATLPAMTPRPEYPRPMLRRKHWVNLNGEGELGAGAIRRVDPPLPSPVCPQSELSRIDDKNPRDRRWHPHTFHPSDPVQVL